MEARADVYVGLVFMLDPCLRTRASLFEPVYSAGGICQNTLESRLVLGISERRYMPFCRVGIRGFGQGTGKTAIVKYAEQVALGIVHFFSLLGVFGSHKTS